MLSFLKVGLIQHVIVIRKTVAFGCLAVSRVFPTGGWGSPFQQPKILLILYHQEKFPLVDSSPHLIFIPSPPKVNPPTK